MSGELGILKRVYFSPYYLLLNIATFFAYYLFFIFVLGLTSREEFLAIPSYIIYALAVSASMLLTISVYSVVSEISKAGVSTSLISALTTAAGGIFASCGCQTPIIGALLYAIGLNALAVSGIIAAIYAYRLLIFLLLIAINLLFAYYVLRKTAARSPKRQLTSINVK